MPSSHRFRDHAAALATVLCWYALALLLFHSLAGGTLLDPNPYDSYTLQAQNWLAGRNYIADGESYSWLELAIYNGRYYQSFPPVPAVLLLPWAAAFGSAVPSNLFIALWGLLGAAGVYACFWKRGAEPSRAAFFALFCLMGSNLFWLSTSGGVWFLAQVCGFALAVWGIFWALCGSAWGQALAGLCLAAAVGCRPFYAVLLALWGCSLLLWAYRGGVPRRWLAAAAVPVALVAAAMMAYNAVRFGSALEFGHNYLPEFQREETGQFNLEYLLPNLLQLLRPVTLDSRLQLHFEVFNGFLFFVANPLFLYWFCSGVAQRRHPLPAAQDAPLPRNGLLLAGCCLAVTLMTCMHRTLGGWQFGARYLVDLFPLILLWYLGREPSGRRPGTGGWALCGMAMLFNLYGAVYMLNA